MEQLLRIFRCQINNNEKYAVNARDLHFFLESKRKFADWIKKRIQDYGFSEDTDYRKFDKSLSKARVEYYLTLDMANSLAIFERNERGRQARTYFKEYEKRFIQLYPKNLTRKEFLRHAIIAEEERSVHEETKLAQ